MYLRLTKNDEGSRAAGSDGKKVGVAAHLITEEISP